MTATVDLIVEDARWQVLGLEGMVESAAAATFATLGLADGAYGLALLATDDARITALNADFRDKPMATNVLSWPDQDLAADAPGAHPLRPMPDPHADETHLGDVALAYETCLSEAEAQKKPFSAHTTHLLVHGILHLLGYDHIEDEDAALMEGLEVAILRDLKVPDPYQDLA